MFEGFWDWLSGNYGTYAEITPANTIGEAPAAFRITPGYAFEEARGESPASSWASWDASAWEFGAPAAVPGPASVSRPPATPATPASLPEILVTAKRHNPALGAPIMETGFWEGLLQPASPGDTWTNVFAGDKIGGKEFPSSDPLGVYDALKYAAEPWRGAAPTSIPRAPLSPLSILPRLNIPAAMQPGAHWMASLLPLLLVAGGALLLAKVAK